MPGDGGDRGLDVNDGYETYAGAPECVFHPGCGEPDDLSGDGELDELVDRFGGLAESGWLAGPVTAASQKSRHTVSLVSATIQGSSNSSCTEMVARLASRCPVLSTATLHLR